MIFRWLEIWDVMEARVDGFKEAYRARLEELTEAIRLERQREKVAASKAKAKARRRAEKA